MEFRPLGRTGIQVSQLCLGTMMFGDWGTKDHEESIRVIHRALAAGINFIAFSGLWHNMTGQVFTVFLIAVAAGEAAIGLGLLIALYRLKHSANVDDAHELRG